MTLAQRRAAARRARSLPRYKSGPLKGRFKPAAKHRRRAKRNPMITARQATAFEKKWRAEHAAKLAAAKKAARKRRRKARVAAPHKRKVTKILGGSTMPKKRKRKHAAAKTHRKVVRHRKPKISKAKRAAAARKGWRKRRRVASAGKAVRRKRRTRRHVAKAPTKRRRVRRNPSRRRKITYARVGFRAPSKPGSKKRRVYRIRRSTQKIKSRSGRSHRYYRYTVKHNPTATGMKSMLMQGAMLYGGLLGMRAINGMLKKYVTSKFAGSLPAQIAPILPAVGGFALALFAPKFIKGKPALVGGLQTGATIALLEAVMENFIKPQLPPSVKEILGMSGIDDMGYGYGYGRVGEYVPQQQQIGYGGYGAEAHEAMALDEYVSQPQLGYDVNEALSDSEVAGMQSGYAAGSLAKSVFAV